MMTRIHKAIEIQLKQGESKENLLGSLPFHYFIHNKIIDALTRSDVSKSVKALIDADIMRLPYEDILIEFESGEGNTRFVWLYEREGYIEAKTALLGKEFLSVQQDKGFIKFKEGQIKVDNIEYKSDGEAIAIGATLAILLLNIKGVDKEIINSDKLNKQRLQKGKVIIPKYTYLKIGTVYNSNGEKLTYSEIKRLKTFHIRSGQTKNQAYGKGYLERRPIYIEPYFVNFKEGDELKIKIKKVGF